MADPEIRGSWTVAQGIVALWEETGGDEWMRGRGAWLDLSAAQRLEFLPFVDGEARPKTPMPYVTFDVGDPITVARDAGKTKDTHNEEYRVPVTFIAHAATKAEAKEVIRTVMSVFQNKPIDVTPDAWQRTENGADAPHREGRNTEWNWIWTLTYYIDATFKTNR